GDHATAMALFGAVMMALYQRERSGRGGMVSTSLMAAGLWSNAMYVQAHLCGAAVRQRPPRSRRGRALRHPGGATEARAWPGRRARFDLRDPPVGRVARATGRGRHH